MTYDPQYLGQNLTNRTKKATQDYRTELMTAMSQLAGKGMLNSSVAFQQYWRAGLSVLDREAKDALQFVYNLTGEHTGEPFNQVAYCVNRMVENIMAAVREKSTQAGALGGGYAEIVNRMQDEMHEKRDSLLADFKHGMMGSERLKKDPVVSIVANQTGSPGAVQQIGVGNFSQTAFAENRGPLIAAIEKALTSPEFQKLEKDQQQGFKDIADTLLDEAAKPNPDPGRLKRWGARLGELGMQLGLHVAAAEIAHIVGKMFGG